MYGASLVVSAIIFAASCFIYSRQRFASMYHPVTFYLAFHGLVFVVRPIFSFFLHYDFLYPVYQFRPSDIVRTQVIIATNLGLISFIVGAWKSGPEPLIFRQEESHFRHRSDLIASFLVVAVLLAPIAISSLASVFTTGFVGMRLATNSGVFINTQGNGWFTDAQMMLVPLSVLLPWIFRFRLWSFLPFCLFVTFRAGTGGRGALVVAAAALALLWMFDRRRKWPSLRLVGLAVPLLVGFYAIGQERSLVRQVINSNEVIVFETQNGFMESMDWANMEFFEYLVETVPRKTGTYGLFVDNLQVFTEPIPRVLWKNKPVGAPIKMFNLFDYGTPIGMTYSLPGYGWMQLGYAGVVLWCGLWGYCLGAIYSWFVRGAQGNFHVAAYFAFLPIFIIAFRDGVLLTILRTGVFYLAPVLVWMWVSKAMGIPDPADPARSPGRRRGGRAPPTPPTTGAPFPLRSGPEEIVPRAWRGRGGTRQAK